MPRHVDDLLTAYVHGELHGEMLERVEEHLKDCRDCRQELERERSVHQVLCSAKTFKSREALWPDIERQLVANKRSQPSLRLVATACAALGLAAFMLFRGQAADRPAFQVLETSGAVTVANEPIRSGSLVREGEALCTGPSASTRLAIADIGEVEVQPGSELSLVASTPTQHRMRLKRGQISARVNAPPRLFVIETPTATAVDLGCAYTLKVDDEGNTVLDVTAGWVALERPEHSGIVPAGWSCVTRNGSVGTPTRKDAPNALKVAFENFDLRGSDAEIQMVLALAKKPDALGLWHMLYRTGEQGRRNVFAALEKLVPSPKGCAKEAVLRLERSAMEQWREEITSQTATKSELPFGLTVPKFN